MSYINNIVVLERERERERERLRKRDDILPSPQLHLKLVR